MKKTILSTAALLIFTGVLVFGQTASSGNAEEPTIEEVYLQSTEIRLIREQAITVDRDMKLLALKNVEDMIESGKVSTGSPDVHYILDYLAGEGTDTRVTENRRLVNYFPMVRKEACKLLGDLGGENSKDTLLDVLVQDDEPMVRAEAAYALGKIGMDDNGEVSRILTYAVLDQDVVNPDSNFAFAVLLALEKIAKANDGLDDPAAFQAIIRIAQGNYVRDVKRKAVQVMDLLREYQ
jgi:HEAT repeat protein